MKLINRCCASLTLRIFRLIVFDIFGLLLIVGNLAMFQLVDTSTQSIAIEASMSLPLGNGSKYALPKGRFRGQDVISLVPVKDRELFVFWHLAKALNSTSANKNIIQPRTNIEPQIPKIKSEAFENIWTYETFSADLLKWTMQTFGWSQLDVNENLMLRTYRRPLCTSKGWCFSPTDFGNMCCPF